MLLNPLEMIAEPDMSKSIQPALVINNNDPTGKHRIQCRISILHQGIEDSSLPWCRPIKSDSFGSAGVTSISVPAIGSIAAVYIPSEEDNSNYYYLGVFTLDNTLPTMFASIYPNCYGFVDANGSIFIVNTQAKTLNLIHCGGAVLEITNTTINVVSAGTLNCKANGNANIFATGNVNIDGATINLNGGSNPASSLATDPQSAPTIPNVSNLTNY